MLKQLKEHNILYICIKRKILVRRLHFLEWIQDAIVSILKNIIKKK